MRDKPNIEDMIKALKCVASMAPDGDCHAELRTSNIWTMLILSVLYVPALKSQEIQ